MENTVFVKVYDAPEINKKEIFRYAGAKDTAKELEKLIDDCINEAKDVLSYKVCYREFPIFRCEGGLDLGFTVTPSLSLQKNLEGCDKIILFAATVGIGIDRLISRYSSISPAKALIFDAIGVERIEALCDAFCRDIEAEEAEKGRTLRPRFSAGYGDLSIEIQKEIISALDTPRKIGVSLGSSLLMSPSKSVTAIVGISG